MEAVTNVTEGDLGPMTGQRAALLQGTSPGIEIVGIAVKITPYDEIR